MTTPHLSISEVAALQYAVLDERRQKLRAQLDLLTTQAQQTAQAMDEITAAQSRLLRDHGVVEASVAGVVYANGGPYPVGTLLDAAGHPVPVTPPTPAVRRDPPKGRAARARKGAI